MYRTSNASRWSCFAGIVGRGMKGLKKQTAFGAVIAAVIASSAANATVIDFDRSGGNVGDGTYSEGGYTMSTSAGHLVYWDNWLGHGLDFVSGSYQIPGSAGGVSLDSDGFLVGGHTDIWPGGFPYHLLDDITFGGGIVDVKANNGSKFTFTSVDYDFFTYAAYQQNSGRVTLTAYLHNVAIGEVAFTKAYDTFAGWLYWTGYANGLTGGLGIAPRLPFSYDGGSLDGIVMDELRITLPGGYYNGFAGQFENIDNLILEPVTATVPEPASWAMMVVGIGTIGMTARYRRRKARAARMVEKV